MSSQKGRISINTENIFPIIKKWLYSEKDIFIREIVSNSSDAINKLKKLATIGEANIPKDEKYRIDVELDKDAKTIKVTDNGIGMTEEEVIKYINQIAFSGALDFFEKYKEKTDSSQIIGHFGLGFYSSFMVSKKVEIDTLSYQEGAKAVKWVSEEGIDFEMTTSDKETRGTTVTMHIDEENEEFLNEFNLRQVLRKYFSFLPIEIYFNGEEKPLNDTSPLWLKDPKDCTDEEYKDFYRNVFNDYQEPLFWIHLNMDYPFAMKGILYFPRMKHEYQAIEGVIKLFNNQVFVADNVKEIIPEFLMLLKGCIDCPDLPLNVSRSYLQSDNYIKRISNHIIKKVGDKLISIFKNDRESYNKYWADIHPFVKFGCMKEDKFYQRIKDIIIFKDIYGNYITLKDHIEDIETKGIKKIFYVTDEMQQAQYIKMFKENEMNALVLDSLIDTNFISFLEMKLMDYKAEGSKESGAEETGDGKKEDKKEDKKDDKKDEFLSFARIDSELMDSLKNADSDVDEKAQKKQSEKYEKLFRKFVGNDKLSVKVEPLKSESMPAVLLMSEQSRRFKDMVKMYNMHGLDTSAYENMFQDEMSLVLNSNNSLIKALSEILDDKARKDDVKMICEHIFDIAKMALEPLTPDEMTKFIERNNRILIKMI